MPLLPGLSVDARVFQTYCGIHGNEQISYRVRRDRQDHANVYRWQQAGQKCPDAPHVSSGRLFLRLRGRPTRRRNTISFRLRVGRSDGRARRFRRDQCHREQGARDQNQYATVWYGRIREALRPGIFTFQILGGTLAHEIGHCSWPQTVMRGSALCALSGPTGSLGLKAQAFGFLRRSRIGQCERSVPADT
jgi:hypothetical protein